MGSVRTLLIGKVSTRSRIRVTLLVCIIATIAGFGCIYVAANLSLVWVPPPLSPFPLLLAAAAVALPHYLYSYLRLSLVITEHSNGKFFFRDNTYRHIQVINRITEVAEGLRNSAS